MIITLSGMIASGKGGVREALETKLNYASIGVGDTWRAKQKELGDIHAINKYILDHPHLDREMDEQTAQKAKGYENCIVDGRAQWYFLPESIKIFLDCTVEKAAERLFHAKRESEHYKDMDEALQQVQSRKLQDQERFQKLYDINIYDKNNYDLVIDTTNLTVEATVEQILNYLQM